MLHVVIVSDMKEKDVITVIQQLKDYKKIMLMCIKKMIIDRMRCSYSKIDHLSHRGKKSVKINC